MTDTEYMKIALELAKKGCGKTSPNPMVGAVIVKNGEIIGKGYHEKYGELHAERNAFADCTASPEGGTIYVTLEPCCHYGKTPPCTEAILENKIARVVIGSVDPNPLVGGKGIKILREHGIAVESGILKDECDRLNRVFFHYISCGTPYVVLKYAMTMDGKIATYTGASKWITGENARKRVHLDRNRYSAVMVGVNTVLKDDPQLTCRIDGGKNPIRIVCDTGLRTPLNSELAKTAAEIRTVIATACEDKEKRKAYTDLGFELLTVPVKDKHVDLKALMLKLGEMKIDSVFIEGGGELNWSALRAGIVNHVQCYIAPKIFGGINAKAPVGGMGVDIPGEAFRLKDTEITELDGDFLLEGEVDYECSQE